MKGDDYMKSPMEDMPDDSPMGRGGRKGKRGKGRKRSRKGRKSSRY